MHLDLSTSRPLLMRTNDLLSFWDAKLKESARHVYHNEMKWVGELIPLTYMWDTQHGNVR